MSSSEIVMIVGGIIAVILGGADVMRSNLQSLTAYGVVVLGIVLIILALI